jgi:hypothetical protein
VAILGMVQRNWRQKTGFLEEIRESHFNFSEWSVLKVDFRNIRWIVISYVVLFFAGTGGLLGVARNAGRGWSISAIILFLIMAVLTVVQRSITGM